MFFPFLGFISLIQYMTFFRRMSKNEMTSYITVKFTHIIGNEQDEKLYLKHGSSSEHK